MNISSWFSLGLIAVIFICSQSVEGQKTVGSISKTIFRRATDAATCKKIKFMKKTESCSEEIGTDAYPILGSCTTYYQCKFTGSIFIPVGDTNCTAGDVFDVSAKQCQSGNATDTCKQIKCLKHLNETSLANSTEIADSASKNETETPNIPTIPDEKSEKETEFTGSTHDNQTHGHYQKESDKHHHDASSGQNFHIGFKVFFVGFISSALSRLLILSS